MSNNKIDLLVLGGGAAGLSVTSGAAQLGLTTTLIEKSDKLGGDCLHHGCIPSKSFIKSAKIAHAMRHASEYGVQGSAPQVDMAAVTDRVQAIIKKIQVHDEPDRFRSYGAEVLFGDAKFVDPYTVQIEDRKIRAKKIVIATGARPQLPPVEGLAESSYVTNETVFQLKTLPKRLFVIGAGFIGMELAQAFVRLGSEVIIADANEQLFPGLDRDIVQHWQQVYEREGIDFNFSTNILRVEKVGEEQRVWLQDASDSEVHVDCDLILVAAGRTPNVEGLNLEDIGVDVQSRGIPVNNRLQTTQKHIYAMGDVALCPYKFTHMAEYHAGVIIRNIVFRIPTKVDYKVVPSVVFSDPEFAMVGLSEQQAHAQNKAFEVLTFQFKDVDRAIAESQTDGMAKVLIHKGYVIGAQILGLNAGELIAEFALAMQAKIKFSQISATIHAYPTLAQVNRRVINTHYTPKLFNAKMRKLISWLHMF